MRLGSRCSRMLLSAALLLAPTQLRAELPNQAKPAKPLKLMESPRGFLEAANFGDMLGLPDWMAMSLSLVSQPMGNVTGSLKRTFSSIDMQAIDLGLSSGLNKDDADKSEFDRWSGRASIASYLGPPPYFSTEIGAAFPLQSLVDSPGINEGIWLQGLWLQRDSKELTLKVGNNLSLDPLLETAAYNFYVSPLGEPPIGSPSTTAPFSSAINAPATKWGSGRDGASTSTRAMGCCRRSP